MQKLSVKKILLPALAAVVVLAAVLVLLLPRVQPQGEKQVSTKDAAAITLSEDGSAVVIDTEKVGPTASFFAYEVDGVTVELFAVAAADGTVRLVLNTCQVCNGSPYAYFVQQKDGFVCQNCRNYFSTLQVGLVSGGCNPVPITEEYYSVEDKNICIPTEFLTVNAVRFKNWKNF